MPLLQRFSPVQPPFPSAPPVLRQAAARGHMAAIEREQPMGQALPYPGLGKDQALFQTN